MKQRGGLATLGWALAGILIVATGLLALGNRETRSHPTTLSFNPSGTSAFAELLRRNGYQVVTDRRPVPRLQPKDVVVAFDPDDGGRMGFGKPPNRTLEKALLAHVKAGGTVISVPIQADFLTASKEARQPISITRALGGPFQVANVYVARGSVGSTGLLADEEYDDSFPLWRIGGGGDFANLRFLGSGKVLELSDGTLVANRFLDKGDNAAVALDSVRSVAGSGSRIVFAEASFGNISPPGLLELLGAWAVGGWNQALFLFAIVVWSLGKRFGLADAIRFRQQGTRELLDAMSATFQRTRSTAPALKAVYTLADSEVRKALRLPRDATRAARDALIPETLQNAFYRVERASEIECRPEDALVLCQQLEAKTAEFIRSPVRAPITVDRAS